MKRISVATIVIFLLVVPFASFKIEKASAGTVTVPDDYLTIQEAINNANDGDTVFVKAGTYFENIVVNKTVSLFGQGRETTFVDGQHLGNVMVVEADNVTIMGFTIRESRRMYPNCAGILLNHVRHANISENNLIDNLEGITLSYSSDSNIAGNNIKTKYMGWGLSILYSTNNSIIENNITENWAAFRLDHSYNNRILGNNVVGNYDYDALYLWDSSNNVLKDNAIDDLQVMGSEVSHFANEV